MRQIEAQRNILDFTLSSLFRRKWKNTALVIVYTLVVFLFASVMFFTHSIRKEAALVLKGTPEMVVQKLTAGRQDLIPADYLQKIRDIRGIWSVGGRLWGYYYDPVVGANYTLMVPQDDPPAAGSIIIGDGISKNRKIYNGDFFAFKSYTGDTLLLQVQRTLSSESALVSADLILMSENDFRELFGIRKPLVTDLTIRVRNPRELNTIALKISQLLPDTRPILRDEILRTYDAVFNWRGGTMIIILFTVVLSFINFAWDKASGLSAEEKKEIGILKAIGWETSDVILLKFWEGTVISLSSFLFGILLAYAHVFLVSSFIFEPFLEGWSVLYPDFRLTPYIDAYQLFTIFFITVIPYTVATIIPSWRAATIDPDAVMRT
ncbi:MAG: ABC transporter permease [Dissulfurispiraceae bacterium]